MGQLKHPKQLDSDDFVADHPDCKQPIGGVDSRIVDCLHLFELAISLIVVDYSWEVVGWNHREGDSCGWRREECRFKAWVGSETDILVLKTLVEVVGQGQRSINWVVSVCWVAQRYTGDEYLREVDSA